MRFEIGMRLSFRSDVSDYIHIVAKDADEAKQKMYDYLKERIPKKAEDIKVDYIKVVEE